MARGWIGFDLDGTLAHYEHWQGPEHIGAPIKGMVELAKTLLNLGEDVRIFTARASTAVYPDQYATNIVAINKWCDLHLGQRLNITCQKDQHMTMLYDDRCCQVLANKGTTIGGAIMQLITELEDAEDNNEVISQTVLLLKLKAITES